MVVLATLFLVIAISDASMTFSTRGETYVAGQSANMPFQTQEAIIKRIRHDTVQSSVFVFLGSAAFLTFYIYLRRRMNNR